MEPEDGLEPPTYALQVRRTTNCATPAKKCIDICQTCLYPCY